MDTNLDATWGRIEAWLSKHAPDVRTSLMPGASPESIAQFETENQVQLPADIRASLKRHDGQSEETPSGIVPSTGALGPEPAWQLIPLSLISTRLKQMASLLEIGEFEDSRSVFPSGAEGDWWSPTWIPIAEDGGGDHVCVDSLANQHNRIEGVFVFRHDSAQRKMLAPSFEMWLMQTADRMQEGLYAYDEDDGLVEVEE